MSTISKKKILMICLIILCFVALLILEIIQFLTSDDKVNIPVFNTATLQTSNITQEEIENEVSIIIPTEEEITISNDSEEIIRLNMTGWNYQKSNLGSEYESRGNENYYKGFSIKREKNTITRIVFNEEYDGKIVSGIYVGMDFKKIKDILGKPTFENEEYNMIGYATKNLYLCIYENEIAVYQNEYYSNKELESMILKYHTGEYTGNANDFSRYIRNNYEDFAFSSDENRNIYLTSTIRGMVIKISDDITVELYKEYDNSKVLEKNMLNNINVSEKYMIEVLENERNSEQ